MKKKLTQTITKIKHTMRNTTETVVTKLNDSLAKVFYDNQLNIIAKKTNFVQRSSSRINGTEFVQAMVLASIDPKSCPLSGIVDTLMTLNPQAQMSVSGLRQRINCPEAVAFLQKAYKNTVESKLKQLSMELNSDKYGKGALQHFSEVLLHDSSSCSLNEILKEEFEGSSGLASKSLVKIDLIYDLKANSVEEITTTDVSEPDIVLSKKILKHVKKATLVIQDLGYFEIETFEKIVEQEGYYLSRLLSGVLVYLNKEDKKPIDLGKHLLLLLEKGKPLDIEVFVTKKKMRTRLLAYLVPDEVFNKRRREYNKKYNGRTASAELIARQRFTILITNVPDKIWPWDVVGTVYKIRWQIELLFKVWKSQLYFDYLEGTKPERIYCLIYARLLAIVLILAIYNVIEQLIAPFGLELSLTKLVNWLKRQARFMTILLQGITSKLWGLLIDGLDLLCKGNWQSNRKTTQQCIEDEISFLESFKNVA